MPKRRKTAARPKTKQQKQQTPNKSIPLAAEKTGCILCKRCTEDELDFGGLHKTKNFQAHHFCLLLSTSINQSGRDHQGILGFTHSDITQEVNSSRNKQCCYCKEYGATLVCDKNTCKKKFHLPCGLMNKSQHDMNKFISFCQQHRRRTNIPAALRAKIAEYKCVICYENFIGGTNFQQLVWADCCRKDVILHITCVKRLALSAGYFTKCPACNNKDDFIATIKKYGVFVPERDASWELERNAFRDLLERHSICDIQNCKCPKGNTYQQSSGNWKLILCNTCGAFGSHKACSDIKDELYVCHTCSSLLAKDTETNLAIPSGSTSSTVQPDKDESNIVEEINGDSENDITYISSDSDDHFSESEPETPTYHNTTMPTYVCPSPAKKNKLSLEVPTTSQVAKKKTVYSQNRNRGYEQQVAKKSTSANRIYSNNWQRRVNKSPEETKYFNTDSVTSTTTTLDVKPNIKIIDNVPYDNSDSIDSKNISSIKRIIDETLEKRNFFKIYCSGPVILNCGTEVLEIDNNKEVEIVHVPDPNLKVSQENIPPCNKKNIETIVIDDSDDEASTVGRIVNTYTISEDDDESQFNYKEKERLLPSGIFENRIRSTTKDLLKRSRSQDMSENLNFFKRMKTVVKIDFKTIKNRRSLPAITI